MPRTAEIIVSGDADYPTFTVTKSSNRAALDEVTCFSLRFARDDGSVDQSEWYQVRRNPNVTLEASGLGIDGGTTDLMSMRFRVRDEPPCWVEGE